MIVVVRRLLWIVFPAYILLVVFLSLTPHLPGMEEGRDKWAHYAAYMAMSLVGLPVPGTRRGRTAVLVFVMTMGAVLEVVQGFVPGRYPDFWDALANVAGAAMGMAVWMVARRVFRLRD